MSHKTSPHRSKFWRVVLAYLLILAISQWVRSQHDSNPLPADLENRATVALPGKPSQAKGNDFGFQDLPGPTANAPCLLLLHGSPMTAAGWQPLIDPLRQHFRVIIPDLNGSGASDSGITDFSPRDNAAHVQHLLNNRGVEHYHLAGFSTGGTTALHLAGQNPNRIRSLYLIAPLAIEELELVGDQTLNHAVYWAQKFYIWCGLNLIPHFGALDGRSINMNYAGHYHQLDPRKLEGVLSRIEQPVAVLHAKNDLIRPAAASKELARRIPQAELVLVPGGHEAPLSSPDTAEQIVKFINSVEQGIGKKRADSSAVRLAEANEPFSYERYRSDLRARVALMVLLLAIATLISEDITCITAGILAARGMLGFFPATLGCFLGILIGDVGLYLIGRIFGPKALRAPPLKWLIKEDQVRMSEQFFAKFGALLVIVTRWLPGMRIPTYVSAGVLRMPMATFLFFFILAALIWTPLLVGISTLVGGTLLSWLEKVEGFAPWILLGFIITIWVLAKMMMNRASRAFEKRSGSA